MKSEVNEFASLVLFDMSWIPHCAKCKYVWKDFISVWQVQTKGCFWIRIGLVLRLSSLDHHIYILFIFSCFSRRVHFMRCRGKWHSRNESNFSRSEHLQVPIFLNYYRQVYWASLWLLCKSLYWKDRPICSYFSRYRK